MPRGITPTRVRRRQSDAKWRASVSMCYNIMKNVIPNQKKLGRRKVSKALTLKETERHIVNLEKKVREIIEDKAPLYGKKIMVVKEGKLAYPASFEDIKHEFALKQFSYFAGNAGSGKKRYNIPADIEASLEYISQQKCDLQAVSCLDESSVEVATPTVLVDVHSERVKTKHCKENKLEHLLTTPLDYNNLHLDVARQHKTPCKSRQHSAAAGIKQGNYTDTPKSFGDGSSSIPNKACKKLPFSKPSFTTTPGKSTIVTSQGFTPVKLPYRSDTRDPMLSFPGTPAKSFIGSPFSCFSMPETPRSCFHGMENFEFTDEEGESSLLCTESIDSLDLDMEFGESKSTETKIIVEKEVSKSKCKRRLDQCYNMAASSRDQQVPVFDTSCLEFDGYLLFYQHQVGCLSQGQSSQEKALTITKMWETLSSEDRSVYAHMANHEQVDSHLSADLLNIDLKPLKQHFNKSPRAHGAHEYTNQEVPSNDHCIGDIQHGEMDLHLVPDYERIGDIHGEMDLHLVPGYEDLGVFYTDNIKQECDDSVSLNSPYNDCHVVPDLWTCLTSR